MGNSARNRIVFNSDWRFLRQNAEGAEKVAFDDSQWESVTLPHTWNASDYNVKTYYRGDAWYRKTFEVGTKDYYKQNNKHLWIEFEACGQYAQVYVNGEMVGRHIGGYSAFRFDITEYLSETGKNTVAVFANNTSRGGTISPMNMDFSIWGGLYRDSWLIETSDVTVDLSDFGASGYYLSAIKNENSNDWNFNVSSKIVNMKNAPVNAEAEIVLRYPKRSDMTWMDVSYDLSGTVAYAIGSDENPMLFDPDSMYESFESEEEYILERRILPLTIDANGYAVIDEDFAVLNPKLWNGVYSPYRYVSEMTVRVDGKVVDDIKDFFGFRQYKVDKTGSYLNGKKYAMKGANKHQCFGGLNSEGKKIGYATTDREKYVDLCIAYELGATYLRLVHYPHDKAMFDLCDAYGMSASAELALGGAIGGKTTYDINDPVTVEFFDNMKLQLTELVKQLHNNPSVLVWGILNEMNERYYDTMKYYMEELNDLAHSLDRNKRYTTHTVCAQGQVGWKTDLIAWNTYPLWYFNFRYGEFAAEIYNDLQNDPRYENYLGIAVTEYGAGANPLHHSEVLERPATAEQWHPEEYANYVHEEALIDLQTIDYLWENSPWQLTDSVTAGRNEGALPCINDKGLVNYERTIKKDDYYLYKANYSEVPFVYIAERRNTPRKLDDMQVKCYSNAASVTLYKMQNGEKTLVGDMKSRGAGIFVTDRMPLELGSNIFVAEFTKDGKPYTDTCDFVKINKETVAD